MRGHEGSPERHQASPGVIGRNQGGTHLWEHLECDGAVRGGADVGGHILADEIADADEEFGQVVVQAMVELARVDVAHAEVLHHVCEVRRQLGVRLVQQMVRIRVERRLWRGAMALGDFAGRPYQVAIAKWLPDVEQARVLVERLPEGRRATSVVGDDDEHLRFARAMEIDHAGVDGVDNVVHRGAQQQRNESEHFFR